MKAGVLGLGNWGTALANHLAIKGFDVLAWSIEEEVVASVNSRRQNVHFLSNVILHAGLRATTELAPVLEREFLVLVFPSAVIAEVLERCRFNPESMIVSAIKGLEGKSLLTPLQYLAHRFPQCERTAVISGPSFAKDIVVQRPCGIVSAAKEEALARSVAEAFSSESMKVYISTDPLGVELGGAIKNVIALAAGVCDGMGYGDSARAGLITRGLAEMKRLAKAMGADVHTLSGLSGLGDLVMTASCDTSRNRTVGLRLGKGEKLSDIIRTLGSVAEGVETTPHALELARKHNVQMPITENVARLLAGEETPQELARDLMSRPMKREFD